MAPVFGGECVALDDGRREVCIVDRMSLDRAIVLALDTLEAWLLASGVESARMHVDGHSYALRAPAQVVPLDRDAHDRRVFRELNKELEPLMGSTIKRPST